MHADDFHIPMCGYFFVLRKKEMMALHIAKSFQSKDTFSTECKWPLCFKALMHIIR